MNAKNVVRTLRVRTVHLILLLVGIVLPFGCSRSEPVGQSSSSPPAVNAPPPPPPLPAAPSATDAAQPSSSQPAMNAPPPPPLSPAVQTPNTVQKKAAVGAGEKGHYESVTVIAPIITPIASYFCIRERLAYDIQIPEAMKLFRATEDRLPKSHEEFMQRIVKDNHINLPLLPEGHRYVYDPKRGELMVEQPAK